MLRVDIELLHVGLTIDLGHDHKPDGSFAAFTATQSQLFACCVASSAVGTVGASATQA